MRFYYSHLLMVAFAGLLQTSHSDHRAYFRFDFFLSGHGDPVVLLYRLYGRPGVLRALERIHAGVDELGCPSLLRPIYHYRRRVLRDPVLSGAAAEGPREERAGTKK